MAFESDTSNSDEQDGQIKERISEEAATWLVRLNSQDTSTEVHGEFADWLAASPLHKDAFDETLLLWEGLAVVRDLPLPDSPAIPPIGEAKHRSTRGFYWLAGSLAASVLVTAMLLLTPPSGRYLTEHGEITQVSLPDGSFVDLSTETELSIKLNKSRRSINLLKGQAFFEVAKDPARPFVVHTPFGEARAIGTTFEVNTLDNRLQVTVTEGVVEVSTAEGVAERISTDQQIQIDQGIVTRRTVDAASVSAWQDGRLVYDGIPLAQLISDLNRYLPMKMTIADPTLADTPVSAVLKIEDQELMLRALSHSLPLRWQPVSDNLIIIQAKSHSRKAS